MRKLKLILSKKILYLTGVLLIGNACSINNNELSSPDNKIKVDIVQSEKFTYNISFNGTPVLINSNIGLVREDQNFTENISLLSVSDIEQVTDSYKLFHGKKSEANYQANKKVFHFENENKSKMDLILQVSNDGVAFRYHFPETDNEVKTISSESTTYNFPANTKTWIQPMAVAKSGWKRTNPSYEEDYIQDVLVDSLVKSEPGWIYPALFKVDSTWVLISETAPYRDYCGTRLMHENGSSEFTIGFPSQKETLNETSGANPNSTLPWSTPWRIIAISKDLGGIAESTLGTDLAKPNVLEDVSFVKPGRASWSWVMLKDDSIVYDVQKRFIDYSADMGWEYSLIDVNWNYVIGYDRIKELADYGASKNVGLILWYNSAGPWNDAPYQPRDLMLTKESREKEFARLKEMGIKGVKVDFFGGDGQDVMTYYLDIIETAAKYGILVNTHGCTLPRGWHRTYPNLVTMEAVKGEEFCTFFAETAANQPTHSCMMPFTRNAFDPMDFTPVLFNEIPGQQRATTNSFELALSVLFLSGVQHYAETDIGMQKVPDYIKQYMKDIPVAWDETKFVDGYPGKLVVIARKTGNTWYVAGINGEKIEKELTLDLSFIKAQVGDAITDITNREVKKETIMLEADNSMKINVLPNGGFVLKFEE